MTREEKVQKKIKRSQERRQKRYNNTRYTISKQRNAFEQGGFRAIKRCGVWEENGRMMQVCSYEAYGTCEYPCNGDC